MPDISDPTPRSPRVVVCLGVHCNLGNRAEKLFARLEVILNNPATDPLHPPFRLRTTNCLDWCEHGPNLVIYPDGVRCHHLDEAALERVLAEHILAKNGAGKS